MKSPMIIIEGSCNVEVTGNTITSFGGEKTPLVEIDGQIITVACPKCGSTNVKGGSVKLISGVLSTSGGRCVDCGHVAIDAETVTV